MQWISLRRACCSVYCLAIAANSSVAGISCHGRGVGDTCEVNAGTMAAEGERLGTCAEIPSGGTDSARTVLVCLACGNYANAELPELGRLGTWGVFALGAACGSVGSMTLCVMAWRVRRCFEAPFQPTSAGLTAEQMKAHNYASVDVESGGRNRKARGRRKTANQDTKDHLERPGDVAAVTEARTSAIREVARASGHPGMQQADRVRRRAEAAAVSVNIPSVQGAYPTFEAGLSSSASEGKQRLTTGNALHSSSQGTADASLKNSLATKIGMSVDASPKGGGVTRPAKTINTGKWEAMEADLGRDTGGDETARLSERRSNSDVQIGHSHIPLSDQPTSSRCPPQPTR